MFLLFFFDYYCGRSQLLKNNVQKRYLTLMNLIIHLFFFFLSYYVFKGSITFKNVQKRLETLFSKTFIFGEFISLGQIKAKRNFLTINLDF